VNQLQVVGKYAADFQGQTASFANNYHWAISIGWLAGLLVLE
jgi:hypothetical protein